MSKDLLKARDGEVSEFAFAIEKAETSGKYGKPAEYWQKFKDAIANGTATSYKRKTSKGTMMDAWKMGSPLYCIPNDEMPDLTNTILKMAQKRALVAATLIATGLSDYFTQDLDDFVTPGTVIDAVVHDAPRTAKPEPMPYGQAAAVTVEKKDATTGEVSVIRMDALSSPQLQHIVEKNKVTEKVEAALTVLEHDFDMARPGAD